MKHNPTKNRFVYFIKKIVEAIVDLRKKISHTYTGMP